MNPITSYNKVFNNEGNWAGASFMRKVGYRQQKPYNLPLPYMTWRVKCLYARSGYTAPSVVMNAGTSGLGTTGCVAFSHANGFAQNTSFTGANLLVSTTLDKARERFIGRLHGGDAGLGIDLAEYRQSQRMLEKRLFQVYDFVRYLRKGRISRAADILGVQKHPLYSKLVKNRTLAGQLRQTRFKQRIVAERKYRQRLITEGDKAFADLFLEFHFGWEPLVKDIYATIDVLQAPVAAGRVVGRAKQDGEFTLTDLSGTATWLRTQKVHVDVAVGATCYVKNHNLALANNLGLINPAALVWEVVPFSFVVDWFVNVGDFLGSFTDTMGYDVKDAYYRIYTYATASYKLTDTGAVRYYGTSLAYEQKTEGESTTRTLGLPGVSLKVRPPWILSPTRALTAISLLIQQGFRK